MAASLSAALAAALAAAQVIALAACSGSDRPSATSGPPASIVHVGPTGVQLYAVRHKLSLADLPIAQLTGLPATGTIEVGAGMLVPLGGDGIALPATTGKAAVRCLGSCQLGDDHTALDLGPGLGQLSFSHLALDGLEAHVEAKAGVLRLTAWRLASPDLELDLALAIQLGHRPGDSGLDGCARFRPTAALEARDPKLYAMVSLAGPASDDGWRRLRITGTVGAPRIRADDCEPITPSP